MGDFMVIPKRYPVIDTVITNSNSSLPIPYIDKILLKESRSGLTKEYRVCISLPIEAESFPICIDWYQPSKLDILSVDTLPLYHEQEDYMVFTWDELPFQKIVLKPQQHMTVNESYDGYLFMAPVTAYEHIQELFAPFGTVKLIEQPAWMNEPSNAGVSFEDRLYFLTSNVEYPKGFSRIEEFWGRYKWQEHYRGYRDHEVLAVRGIEVNDQNYSKFMLRCSEHISFTVTDVTGVEYILLVSAAKYKHVFGIMYSYCDVAMAQELQRGMSLWPINTNEATSSDWFKNVHGVNSYPYILKAYVAANASQVYNEHITTEHVYSMTDNPPSEGVLFIPVITAEGIPFTSNMNDMNVRDILYTLPVQIKNNLTDTQPIDVICKQLFNAYFIKKVCSWYQRKTSGDNVIVLKQPS